MSTKCVMLEDNVLVRLEAPMVKEYAGLIIPPTVGQQCARGGEGIVVAVGPGKITFNDQRKPMEVKVGDRVVFNNSMGVRIMVDGREHTILQHQEVLMIMDQQTVAG